MFHRPKSEEKETEAAAGQKPVQERPPINVYIRQPQAAGKPVTQTNAPAVIHSKTEEQQPMSNSEEQPKQPPRPIEIPGSSSYQPQPARAPGSVFGSGPYPGVPGQAPKAHQGRRLVIGEGITLSGEIESCEYLVIEGTVEAALKGASVLEIAESGAFFGTVEIDEATVAGRFEGEITCNGRLTITATGSVTGTVSYKELAVEAGATLDGKINPLSGSKAAATGKKPDKSAKVKGLRNDNADDGGELPLTGSGN